MPTIEEMKLLKSKAAASKKAVKSAPKPKKLTKREKKYAEGGEETWDNAVAPPRIVKGKLNRYEQPLLETYQLPTFEWSFSPNPTGPISIYGARANRAYGWDGQKVVVKADASRLEVWWNSSAGVQRGLASSKEAVAARQKFSESMSGRYAS